MAVTADDLRRRLKYPQDQWTSDDADFATAAIESSRVVVESVAGPQAVEIAEETTDEPRLRAIDEATLAYAALLFSNPERVMQRRAGADNSVSFADSSRSAIGLTEIERILSGHFTLGRARSTWLSNELESDVWLTL